MAVYVYRNLTTGETFELKQRITEPALSAHPETGDPVKRLIQPVGIAFKGSGFYVTDSRSAGQKAGQKDGSKGGGQDGAAKEGSSDAKKDAPKPAKSESSAPSA